MIGTSIGPYRITAKLGAGGMGEVYRARDTKLDRDVAIKILPDSFAHDAERVARFEREAKVLAALNHPNIAQIYGLEERALVMELVEGPTLAERIAQGALPLDEALNIAKQIAEALEAAHEKGITHRDLKPANVKLRPDGTVKVLDFGLATAAQSATADGANATISPTLTLDFAATRAGMIMGTAAYMSPEQASGKPVDKRSDIWSFGVVLWEMLTGKRLFEGETVSHVMAAVLTKEPDFSQVPTKVRTLLQRCLEKDPKHRLRDIGDWQLLLQEAPSANATSAVRSGRLGWTAAALLFVTGGTLALFHFREMPPEVRVVSSTLLPPEGADFSFDAPSALPALSPDGRRIVFGAKPKNGKTTLWLRQLDSPSAQPLPETGDAVLPFWSPDSRWVAFGQGDKLKKIDVHGGPPVVITDLHGPFRGGNWNRDGVILFGTLQDGSHGLFRVASSGGMASPATTLERQSGNHLFPWFLPDGRHFLYTSRETGDIPVRVGSLDEPGEAGKVVAQASSNAVYAQGHLLYLRENTLMAQPFDLNRLETAGEGVPLAEGVPTYTHPSRGAGFSVSATGLLVYQTGAILTPSKIVWKDRQGKMLGDLGESPGRIFAIALSPDGRRLAVLIVDLNRKQDIWIYEVASGIPTRFSFDPTAASNPVWSSDGSMLYFASDRRGQWDLFRKPSNGASTEELLLGDSATKYPESVSPDGKLLLYSRRDDKTGYDIWVHPLEQAQAAGRPEPRPFLQAPSNQTVSQFSPDGHWVAYQSEESGHFEVYVAPFPGPGGKRQISYGGGVLPRWRRDGKELFYETDGKLMAAEVTVGNGILQVGRVQKLFDVINTRGYDVSADGQKFVMTGDPVTSSAPPLNLLQNWPAALRK